MERGIELRIGRTGRKTYRAVCWDPAGGPPVKATFKTLTEARTWRRQTEKALQLAAINYEVGGRYVEPEIHRPVRGGLTYAICSDPYDGWVKVGRTAGDTPESRLGGLQTGNPRKLVVRATWPLDVEAEFHRAYAALRGCGEWFAVPAAFIEDMARLSEAPQPLSALRNEWSVYDVQLAADRPLDHTPEALATVFARQASA